VDDKHSKIQAQLAAVRKSYIASLADKHTTVTASWNSLKSGWVEESYDALYLVVHGLAGSAETFGFPEITHQARTVVNHLKSLNRHAPPSNSEVIVALDAEIIRLLSMLAAVKQS
jgi:hypothetical protein